MRVVYRTIHKYAGLELLSRERVGCARANVSYDTPIPCGGKKEELRRAGEQGTTIDSIEVAGLESNAGGSGTSRQEPRVAVYAEKTWG
jgi:hypothetical protein